tara:strand:- start:1 stop:444 length:444 start_codon:yes stop_codon:yes gene_type:complete
MIKTFRGLLADGQQLRIKLSTNNGMIGYTVKKFQIFPNLPGTADIESTCMIFKFKRDSVSTATATVNFDDPTLLAVAYMAEGAAADEGQVSLDTVVFDNVVFNQDIYITHTATKVSESCNFYIELEQMKLDLNEATVATLKDMRGRE